MYQLVNPYDVLSYRIDVSNLTEDFGAQMRISHVLCQIV